MYCPFCGSEISDDSTFCPMCGQSINSPDVNVRKEEKESKKATGTMHWVLVLITVVLLLVTMIGIGTALYLHFRDSSEKISQEIKKDDLKSVPFLVPPRSKLSGCILCKKFGWDALFSRGKICYN